MKAEVVNEIKLMSDYSDYYKVRIYCKNCDNHDVVFVLKGVQKSGKTTTCENCRCEVKL